MHAEIFLAIMVLAVALLVAADFFRRASEGPHEHTERPAYDAGRESSVPPRASRGAPAVTAFQPARTGRPGSGLSGSGLSGTGLSGTGLSGSGPSGSGLSGPGRTGPGAGPSRRPPGRQGAAAAPGSPGAKGSWLVRTRLSLLAAASALAAAVATAGAIRAIDIVQGSSYHSNVSSIRDGAIASVILACIATVVALVVGGWAAVILIRSVLRPLRQLRTGAVELAEVRLPDALRGGGRGPLAVRSVGISSSDEIGEIARAFDRVQAEVLGLTSDEAGLRGKLGEMFVELSSRSQTLVERQIRLIDELEQDEQDAGRLASLFKMDHIATRMRRHSQNLLILAGHELPGRWSQPVALADVIRAAVSEIEEYERVSLSAQAGITVSGTAVKDLVHLLAELAENATSLSSAGTPVDVSGRSLASGGVLVDITDQGVGMNPEVLAEANRRLDSPPAMDFAVSRNMGLFVVGRLAARHGIKVRLQPAAAGGLTALVWLPDAIASGPDDDPGDAGPGWGAHAAARPGLPAGTGPGDGAGLDRRPARPEAATQSMWSAPVLEDVRVRPPQDPASAAGARPGRHAWPDSRPQPSFHPHPAASAPLPAASPPPGYAPPIAAAQPSAPAHQDPFAQQDPYAQQGALAQQDPFGRQDPFAQPSAAASPQAPALPARPQPPAPFQRLVASPPPAKAQPAAASGASPAISPDEPSAGETDDDADERRLPIYDAVESDWFGNRRKLPGGSAAAEGGWTSPADPGWGAAKAAVTPASSGTTTAGLPVRTPRANLVPGTAGGAQPDKPPIPRSASALRDRLSGFQHGTSQGRAAVNRDGQDQAP
jgi:signal transduction histidine kinase